MVDVRVPGNFIPIILQLLPQVFVLPQEESGVAKKVVELIVATDEPGDANFASAKYRAQVPHPGYAVPGRLVAVPAAGRSVVVDVHRCQQVHPHGACATLYRTSVKWYGKYSCRRQAKRVSDLA